MNHGHSLPAEVYALVEQTPGTVLLEGNASNSAEPPWTQLFLSPLVESTADHPSQIPAVFDAIERAVAAGHFAAGFFSYECGAHFEPKAIMHPVPEGRPLAWFGVYDRSYVFDHETGTFPGGEPQELVRLRAEALQNQTRPPEPPPEISAAFALSEPEYARRIAAIHDFIRAGDVYQLNFTAPFRVEAPGSVAAHYARLRARQPVGYGAFLHWRSGRHILSFSPELFFRIDQSGEARNMVARPMKGTAPRGRTTKEDRQIAEWLRNDPKNQSENVMIVDLLRNDLGRVARFGTVRTENLFAVDRYPTLWQMTSTVTAELRPEAGFHDIFRALFPCGSITGAPKVRSMQLLAELEEGPRGVYTGAIGFFSSWQTVFNVAIRTLELAQGCGTFGAGSGIVIDSDPAAEYRECLLKAKFLAGPAHRAAHSPIAGQPDTLSLIETMLWNGCYPLLDLHLDRLADSSDYFGFACDRAAIRAALEEHTTRFADSTPRKVRLLLTSSNGSFQIGDEAIAPADENRAQSRIGRVCVSKHRTDPADPMLYHKTTQRPLYALEYGEASRAGFDDVLFLNLRGEVTEGAISNIFIEKDGQWFTPPIECGLLAGVYRRHLLATRPEMEERILQINDLRRADAVYICNAVRGLRRVVVAW